LSLSRKFVWLAQEAPLLQPLSTFPAAQKLRHHQAKINPAKTLKGIPDNPTIDII
jgi:hypothetical protein